MGYLGPIRNYLNEELMKDKEVESCTVCGQPPEFERWPGRELVLLKHKCEPLRMNIFEGCGFPKDADRMIGEWNQIMGTGKKRILETAKVE
jgi:hypothetical protein